MRIDHNKEHIKGNVEGLVFLEKININHPLTKFYISSDVYLDT